MVVFPEALTTVSMGMNVDETGFSLMVMPQKEH